MTDYSGQVSRCEREEHEVRSLPGPALSQAEHDAIVATWHMVTTGSGPDDNWRWSDRAEGATSHDPGAETVTVESLAEQLISLTGFRSALKAVMAADTGMETDQ